MSTPEPNAPRRKNPDPLGLILVIAGGAALVWNAIAFGRPLWKTGVPSDVTPFQELFGLLAAVPTLIVLVLAWFCLHGPAKEAAQELQRTGAAREQILRSQAALLGAFSLVLAASVMTVIYLKMFFWD
jgi:hypothetical protein